MLSDKILSQVLDVNIRKYMFIFILTILFFINYVSFFSITNLIKGTFIFVFLLFFVYNDYIKQGKYIKHINEFEKQNHVNKLLEDTSILKFLDRKEYLSDININTYNDIVKHSTYFIKAYRLSLINPSDAKQYYDCAKDERDKIINLMSSFSVSKVRYDHYSKHEDYDILFDDIEEFTEILNHYLKEIGLLSIDNWEKDINHNKSPFYSDDIKGRDKYSGVNDII